MQNKSLFGNGRCCILAEVGNTHEGSLGLAHSFIDAVAKTGANGIKFQTHIAEAESTVSEPFRVKFGTQDRTRYDYWKRMEFSEDQWRELARHARERGLLFVSSPFSIEAVDLLERVEVPVWKIASGEAVDSMLLDRVLHTGLPVLVSTGLISLEELDEVISRIKQSGSLVGVLQCTTMYPCPPERIGLNLIEFFRDRYECPVGLSDHSGTIFPGLAAATIRADILEVHVTLSREMFGPDIRASVTTDELRQLVEGVRFVETMLDSPVVQDASTDEVRGLRQLFTKSVVASHSLKSGTVLTASDLSTKKPGGGFPPEALKTLIGRRLCCDLEPDTVLKAEHLKVHED